MPTAGAEPRDRAVTALVLLDLGVGAIVTVQSLAARLAVEGQQVGTHASLIRGAAWLLIAAGLVVIPWRGWRRAAPALWAGAIGAWHASLHPLASPHDVLLALYAARHASIVAHAMPAAAGAGALTVVIALAATVGVLPPRGSTLSTAYGSAAWSTGESLRQSRGLIIGRTPTIQLGDDSLRYAGEGHLLTVAPTRSGKGVSAVIPTLLTFQGSLLVTDLKGENHAVTARARRGMGQRVLALDPFGVATRESAAFNPLDRIDPSRADAIDDARALADMLVVPEAKGAAAEAFWDEEARALLVGLILHAAADSDPAARTLTAVHQHLTRGPRAFTALLRAMAGSTAAGGAVARSAAQLAQKSPRERSAVLSTAQSHTHFLESPRMAAVLDETRVPFDRAMAPGAPASTYLILPPEHLDGYRRWLRLMIGSAIQRLTRRRQGVGGRTLFLLDEFAHLGRMRPVEQGVTLAGAYGATFWLLVQSMAQLRAIYGESAGTFLANADVLQAFGVTDWETAEHLSRLAGDATVPVATTTSSTRGVTGLTESERGRRLITPDEIRLMPPDRALLIVRGVPPIAARRADYRRDRLFRGLYDSNPLHAGPVGG
ncbi:MAG TPA: type IV secretory system conjugative DNA transfer family protein [Gemmatimonadaceae bacterium]|nr:type IV secretory system conjugative DNA transfer family protein [Gemmatimonadaceae bacterium]